MRSQTLAAVIAALLLGCGGGSKPATLDNKPKVDPMTSVATSKAAGLQFKIVDNDSEYMRNLFAHVGSDKGKATDPVALAAGIAAEPDMWSDDNAGKHTDYYLLASDRDGATGRQVIERYVSALATKDSSFKIPDDHELGFEQIEPKKWRSYYLHRAVELDGTVVQNASSSIEPNTGRTIVLLDFTENGGRVLGDLTAKIVGKKLATLLDGNVKSAPIINGAIRGGRASITMGGSDPSAQEREAAALVEVLKSQQPKP